MRTKIPYIDETANCVLGCSKCSPACENCWAIKTVGRLRCCVEGRYENPPALYRYLVSGDRWTGKVSINFNAFNKCRRRKPTSYLLSSLGDWLHESLSTLQIRHLLVEMHKYAEHRFYTLTKRPQRWRELGPIPPNVWLGASVWDQESYERVIQSYCSIMDYKVNLWLSAEPLLSPITVKSYNRADWIVVGCESGPKRRPCKIEWIRSIVQQCKEYRIPCFVKQIDLNGKVSRDPAEWPSDLRVQEIPQ